MKKARIIVFILLGIAIIFGLLGWWYWSLGSIATAERPVLRLVIEQGNVFITNKGTSIEEPAKSGMEVSTGDVIRTGSESRASVVATGRSDLRLSENSEVQISDADTNWSGNYIFRFKLKTGRVWSRVMRLLDLESVYEGQTDNVVATVRGTAFAMHKTGQETQLYVDHSAVSTPILGSTNGEDVFTIGEWANFDFEGRVMLRGDIASSTWPEQGWIDDERLADNRFAESARKIMLDSLKGSNDIAMDDWAYGLSRSSENMHLRFSGDACRQMTVRYLGRRIYDVYDLMNRGKSGLAFQFLTDLEKEINEKSAEGKCNNRIDFVDPVGRILVVLGDTNPEDEMYKLKLKFEEIYVGLYPENSPGAYFARAVALDARLDELERFGCRPDFRKPMENAMDAVEQGLARQDKDFESLPAGLDEEVAIMLANKTHVQHVRLERFIEKLDECRFADMNPNIDDITATSTTSTDMEATSTINIDDVVEPNNAANDANVTNDQQTNDAIVLPQDEPIQNTVLDLSRIQLFAQPNPINVGDVSNLYVKGIRKDGTEIDVTGNATFEQVGNLGVFSGASYISRSAGSVTLIARVNDGGTEYSSQVSLKINEPMVLSYLEISGGNYQVLQGTSRQLSVIAHYTNGEVKDVTSASSYSVSNSDIGTMRGSVFVAGANALGVETVIARYSESGIIKQDEINFEIIPNTSYTITP